MGIQAYKTHMKLTIMNVSSGDDGIYKCVAKNPRGETDGVIRLYGKFKLIVVLQILYEIPHMQLSNYPKAEITQCTIPSPA